MTNLEFTREQLQHLALTDNPIKRLMLATTGWAPFQHLELAGQLKQSGDDMVQSSNEFRKDHPNAVEPPMHVELEAAMRIAAEKAEAAFTAAVETAFQLYRITALCDCQRCQMRRQRTAARQS